MSLFNIYTEHFKLSREKKVNQKKKNFSSGQMLMAPGGRRAVIQCRLCVDQMCRVLVGQMKGWGEGELSLSLWAQEQFLQPNWHLFPPSPAGPASAPCSTELPTGTTCRKTKKGNITDLLL